MPKNKGKGGKKFKRGKHENITRREMIFKEEQGQAYGIIDKMLGNGRVYLSYFLNDKENNMRKYDALGIIRGSMKKRVWICPNDVVLVSIREFEEGKVDILHKYENDEVSTLVKSKEIPNAIYLNASSTQKENANQSSKQENDDNLIENVSEDEIIFSNDYEVYSDEEELDMI